MGITTRYQGTSVFDKLQVHKGKFYIETYAMPLQWTIVTEHDFGVSTAVDTSAYTVPIACKLAAVWFTVNEQLAGADASAAISISKAAGGATKIVDQDLTITTADTSYTNSAAGNCLMLPCTGTSLAATDVVYVYTAAAAASRTAGKVKVTMLFEAV